MKVEKKNWILLGLVALLCFTGFLNYKFNENIGDSPQVAMQAVSYTHLCWAGKNWYARNAIRCFLRKRKSPLNNM